MWETIKGIMCLIFLIAIAIGILIAGWTVSIMFRIIAIIFAIIGIVSIVCYAIYDYTSSKLKKKG